MAVVLCRHDVSRVVRRNMIKDIIQCFTAHGFNLQLFYYKLLELSV